MSKCYSCLVEEHFKKISIKQVSDTYVVYDGKSLCYNHLFEYLGWENE